MDDEECAISQGIKSQLGQRDAYNKLIMQQYSTYSSCFITYYTMLTYYSLSIRQATGKQQVTAPPLLKLHKTGCILDAPTKFRVDSIIYTLKRRPCVINLSPHIPYDLTNEISCHSILLMHYPWPMHGEVGLVLSEAITSVKNIMQNDMFPNYIKETLDKYITTSDVQENENEYISNKKDNADSSDDIELYDDPPSNFFIEEETSTSNVEIDYSALQQSLQNNINLHGIISNLPLNTYLCYKKIILNALTIYMNNYNLII